MELEAACLYIYTIYIIYIYIYLFNTYKFIEKHFHGMSHFEPSLNPCDPATGRPASRRTSL